MDSARSVENSAWREGDFRGYVSMLIFSVVASERCRTGATMFQANAPHDFFQVLHKYYRWRLLSARGRVGVSVVSSCQSYLL